jgi:hypothetical protein
MLAHQLGMLQVNRAGVRLFFRDADLRQELDQDLGLDLQFARQFIDTDLIGICHSPLSSLDLPNTRYDDYENHHSAIRRVI